LLKDTGELDRDPVSVLLSNFIPAVEEGPKNKSLAVGLGFDGAALEEVGAAENPWLFPDS
jgi:hypothetical protein